MFIRGLVSLAGPLLNLLEELELVHGISADDAYSTNGCWHNRFSEKRRVGEWCDLTAAGVKAFRQRKFM